MTEVEDNHIINHSQHVIIEMPSGTVKIVNLKPNINISLGKFGSFNSNNLIGKYFGLSYEIYGRNGDLRPVGHVVKNISLEETEANNQLIVDDTTVQKLTFEEVLKLKEQGLEGTIKTEEIINKMIDSHSEFSKKTEFSKAKYIERKKKKFTKAFTPVRPTMYTIAKYFFQKNPDKIRYLRVDTLSHMLSLANVRAYSKLLVVDDTQGLIVTSILERMGGFGKVVAVHEGDNHNYDIIRYMNYPKRITDILHTVPFCMVDPGVPNDPFDLKTEEELAALTDDEKRSYLRRKAYFEGRAYSRKLLFDGDFDG
ncbi:Gcd10p family-domain-containing protein [Pilobolus umbonatus]|nr:Gcd10p family-domain-containing protein [Pilobolus umbonatus]